MSGASSLVALSLYSVALLSVETGASQNDAMASSSDHSCVASAPLVSPLPVTGIAAHTPITFRIASQLLTQALLEFSAQSGWAVLMPSSIDPNLMSAPLHATAAPIEGLSQLLSGSGLTFKSVGEQSVVIVEPAQRRQRRSSVRNDDGRAVLEEVTVTAGKRVSSLQDTPMAITALDYQTLIDNRITGLFDFASLVPSLQVVRNGDHTASMLYLRGVGADNPTEAGDSGVATHVDGIYTSRSQGTAVLLYDLEQIEILRGPQGSLFGRNATSGVINYHSVKPVSNLEAHLDLTLGDFDYYALEAMVNVPVSETWSLRIAGAAQQRDGLLEFAPGSVSNDAADQYNNLDLNSYRLTSLWQPRDDLSWWVAGERYRNRGNGSLPAVDYDTPVLVDTLGSTDLTVDSYRSRIQWQAPSDIQVTYIAGYSEMTRNQLWDGDGNSPVGSETDPAYYHQSNHTVWSDHYSWQHELQVKSADELRLRWLLAYFYFEEESDIRFDLEHQDTDGSGWGGAASHSFQQPHRGSQFEAFYGQLRFDLNTRWALSVGARSGTDTRFDEGGRNIGCPDLIRADRGGDLGAIAVNRDSASADQCFVTTYNDVEKRWHSTTYMARMEYRPNANQLYYLMMAEGFKPGIVEDGNGVSGVFEGSTTPEFVQALDQVIAMNNGNDERTSAYIGPEESRNWELGFKLDLLERALTLNGALFHTSYNDLQVSTVALDVAGSEVFRSSNAASATIDGLELELNWATSLNGQLSGHVSFLDARYDEFLAVDSSFPQYGQTWNPSANNLDVPDLVDFSGNRMKQAPKSRFSLSYKHHFEIAGRAKLTPLLRVTYSDEVFLSAANRQQRSGRLLDNRTGLWVDDPNGSATDIDLQPAYWQWDASLVFAPYHGRWQVEGFVRNLTDELIRYDVHAPDASQPLFYLAPPRTLGLKFSANFR